MFQIFNFLNNLIVNWLHKPIKSYEKRAQFSLRDLEFAMQPGDILLVEGNQRVSSAIKYLTQSTWSHAAFYIGQNNKFSEKFGNESILIESDLKNGVTTVPLSNYENFNTRICRPIGLPIEEKEKVIEYMIDSIGLDYDRKNILDLMRYLLPQPPIPQRFRRRMIALGSGTPSKVICSTLIAKAFQSVNYPILPIIQKEKEILEEGLYRGVKHSRFIEKEYLHIRHHSLFVPRDFDLSPYFSAIKPTIEKGFNYKTLPIKGFN